MITQILFPAGEVVFSALPRIIHFGNVQLGHRSSRTLKLLPPHQFGFEFRIRSSSDVLSIKPQRGSLRVSTDFTISYNPTQFSTLTDSLKIDLLGTDISHEISVVGCCKPFETEQRSSKRRPTGPLILLDSPDIGSDISLNIKKRVDRSWIVEMVYCAFDAALKGRMVREALAPDSSVVI